MTTLTHTLLIAAALALHGCGSDCLTRSDCDRGQYCEFTSGECRDGCKNDDDCGGTAVCEEETGVCRSTRPPRDAGILDAGTSTVTDAGT